MTDGQQPLGDLNLRHPTGNSASLATPTPWRLLHIDDNSIDILKIKLILDNELPVGSTVDHACHLDEGLNLLEQTTYDAVLVSCSFADAHGMNRLRQALPDATRTPLLVLSGGDDVAAAVKAGNYGAHSFLFKSQLSGQALVTALRKAVPVASQSNHGQLPERRKEPRYEIVVPAVIFPIQPDGTPGREIAASTVNISRNGAAVLAQQDSESVPDICLLGVECRDGVYRYATVEWRYRRLSLPAIRFGGRFLRRTDDPFHTSHLTPRFDPDCLRFKPSMDAAALHQWTARGILQRHAVDCVKVCPECESLPTFRDGCPQCGSANTEVAQLIHHFACAHVAPAADYGDHPLVCPKCRLENLVVGADFEYLDGPCGCHECDWTGADNALIAECLQCGHRFPANDAIEKDVLQFHVDRLDPLALIDDQR